MSPLFADFDFNALNAKDFKEDSVREILILPILSNSALFKAKF